MSELRHVRARWPEPEVPPGEPLWLHYELDESADVVVRSVDLFPNGAVNRNSIEVEERGGKPCPSLIDCSIAEGFAGVELEEITRDEFEEIWARGKDTPFWNVG
ncbi:MAG: hypothetical protein EPN98_22040 [Phenylobacterium sp.]|uniref:DUF6881 domain-containing protein n=1 Tax=Phenylobacterium sp. TaxID=1871053 RepID=UPI0012147EB2|nr:hypothetical protein [Phenylobacterium sp.]TAL28776.1 MAG: hypothetical protein EPN98_22040 [Phenylobacterium sp.]